MLRPFPLGPGLGSSPLIFDAPRRRSGIIGFRWQYRWHNPGAIWLATRKPLKRLVVDAVLYEPVSAPQFPDNRENNRELVRIWPADDDCPAEPQRNSKRYDQIPCSSEQGILAALAGKCRDGSGIREGVHFLHGKRRFLAHLFRRAWTRSALPFDFQMGRAVWRTNKDRGSFTVRTSGEHIVKRGSVAT
jgi:hypothetical protein